MPRRILLFTLLCLAHLHLAAGCRAQAFTLANQGKPAAQIVVDAAASPTEKYAAQELQRALEKISGARLAITSEVAPNTANIVIGTPQSAPSIKSANLFNTNNDEEIRIVQQGNTLYLAGPVPRAALQATYTFLQDTLGARWFWPGESGEYLPSRSTITVNALDIRQIPSLAERSLGINSPHYDEDTLVWMGRNRLNWHHVQGRILPERVANLHQKGMQVVVGGHNATLDQTLLDAHPEYMALYAGKRQKPAGHPPHLCWSNLGVQQAMAQKITRWWDDNPTIDSVSFFGADHNHFCECAQCAAFAPDVSTRWQKFSKIVISLVNKTHPNKHYQTLAYQAYRNVPTEVAPFDLIGYCTYNINYTKPITDPSNAKAREEIAGWRKLGANIGIRGYQFIPFRPSMYTPITSLIMEEIAWTHQNGLQGWKSEVTPFGYPQKAEAKNENWVTNRMALYAVAQAMWNAQTKPETILADWSQHVFGPASAPMLDYYQVMERTWRGTREGVTYFLHPPASFVDSFISKELLDQAEADFTKARSALNNLTNEPEKQRILAQINLEAAMLDNWRQVFLLQQGRAFRMQAYAPRVLATPQVTAAAEDPAWNGRKALPEFEDIKSLPATEKTQAFLQWDSNALYLRFINHDSQIQALKTLQSRHDSNVFGDDNIELFLDDPAMPGHYFHLAASAKGVRYDAKADGAMNFDKSWNPQWTAKTTIGAERWILDVKLPFASFGIKAGPVVKWKMSFKRSGANRHPNTGWPDASYHSPSSFGTVTLVEKAPQQKRALLYDAGGKSDGLRAELGKLGFSVQNVTSDESEFATALANGYEAIVLRRPITGGFGLSDQFMEEKIAPFLRDGGLILLATGGNIPLQKWFGIEPGVNWSAWKIDVNRKTVTHDNGDWQRKPNDIAKVIAGRLTPASGFKALSDEWKVLATMRMADGEEMAYLLTRKVGKGTLILTSSNFGYGGGHEMFGNQNPQSAAQLLDNLLAAHQS